MFLINVFHFSDAFLVHGKGPAVGGQGEVFNETDATTTSSNVVIKNNNIDNIKCWNNEVPALFGDCGGHGCVVNDPRGAVLQTIKTFDSQDPYLAMDKDGKYQGNVVSDMQIIVAQAILEGKLADQPDRQTGPNSIDQGIVDWAQVRKNVYAKAELFAFLFSITFETQHDILRHLSY